MEHQAAELQVVLFLRVVVQTVLLTITDLLVTAAMAAVQEVDQYIQTKDMMARGVQVIGIQVVAAVPANQGFLIQGHMAAKVQKLKSLEKLFSLVEAEVAQATQTSVAMAA